MEDKEFEESEMWVWTECKKNLEDIEYFRSRDIKQKSRVKWAALGDENTSFFHNVVNGRKARNAIPGLEIDGVWVTKPQLIKKEVLRFFRNHFCEKTKVRPVLVCKGIKRLTEEDGKLLTSMFTQQEIKDAVFDCGSNKAPGPDGFNFRFVKRFWSFLEGDVSKILHEFFETGSINQGCGSSFITLIPKVKTPIGLKDYRPIPLIGLISKIISKVLANRIKKVVGSVILEHQSSFLKDVLYLMGRGLLMS